MSRGRRSTRTRRVDGNEPQAKGPQQHKRGGQKGKGNQQQAKKQPKAVDEAAFWSSKTPIPEAPTVIRLAEEANAVIRSLGPPPLNGHEAVAEHYFEAVYGRAVGLASALAASGGLLEDPSET